MLTKKLADEYLTNTWKEELKFEHAILAKKFKHSCRKDKRKLEAGLEAEKLQAEIL